MKIRLLGDRVSRATAWKIAAGLGWDDIKDAEYLAVASLQADALVTDDDALAAAAEGIVRVAAYEDLTR
jgi:predicted nucleic acid-binding protein